MADIPQWAAQRACDLANVDPDKVIDYHPDHVSKDGWGAITAFARYIAEHEQPPVDPLLLEARELVKAAFPPNSHTYCNCREEIDAGSWDNRTRVKVALAALKRGIELAKDSDNG